MPEWAVVVSIVAVPVPEQLGVTTCQVPLGVDPVWSSKPEQTTAPEQPGGGLGEGLGLGDGLGDGLGRWGTRSQGPMVTAPLTACQNLIEAVRVWRSPWLDLPCTLSGQKVAIRSLGDSVNVSAGPSCGCGLGYSTFPDCP
ncbi:hypothetical protein Aple_053690 [Acrocarpospora pleiomorpha]|uniref:Uncharacterized protein n=1 Tax=Acrocarpospora pleiomorpha TaxID=90975 RepID=A0A5M3XNE7_9ACTN|nr:hypothetical protein Aple_053690 [Acrocarpospora pleiomorpha]